jgi:hypothetical protein
MNQIPDPPAIAEMVSLSMKYRRIDFIQSDGSSCLIAATNIVQERHGNTLTVVSISLVWGHMVDVLTHVLLH